jgi:hypothetical protein
MVVCDEIRNVRGNWYYKLPPARLMHCTIAILDSVKNLSSAFCAAQQVFALYRCGALPGLIALNDFPELGKYRT